MGILKEFTKFYIIDGGERLIAGRNPLCQQILEVLLVPGLLAKEYSQ
jgi:hypothetical protein